MIPLNTEFKNRQNLSTVLKCKKIHGSVGGVVRTAVTDVS